MQRPAVTQKQILIGVAVLAVIGVGIYLWKNKDPFGGRGPDFMAYLGEEKTLCENRAQDLKAKGIDGEAEYEKVQAAASACIGYLQGVVDQGGGDKEAIRKQLDRLNAESLAFRTWADRQLGGAYGAEEKNVDPLALATAALKLLGGQEQARRKAVKASLENCKFKSWNEIAGGR